MFHVKQRDPARAKRSAHSGLPAYAVVPTQPTNGERMITNRQFASRAARKSSPPKARGGTPRGGIVPGGQLQAIADMQPRPD